MIHCKDLEFRKQLMADLEQVNREPIDDEGKIKLESKKDYKKRTGRSLDFFDSLLMRMLFEIKNPREAGGKILIFFTKIVLYLGF